MYNTPCRHTNSTSTVHVRPSALCLSCYAHSSGVHRLPPRSTLDTTTTWEWRAFTPPPLTRESTPLIARPYHSSPLLRSSPSSSLHLLSLSEPLTDMLAADLSCSAHSACVGSTLQMINTWSLDQPPCPAPRCVLVVFLRVLLHPPVQPLDESAILTS